MDNTLPTSSPVLALPDIIQQYLDGQSVQVLAKKCHVSRRTIYNWMLAGIGDDQYYNVVTQCLVARVADADDLLDNADDQVHIARAREIARFARFDLERRRPALYGPKQELSIDKKVVVHIHREQAKPSPVDITPNTALLLITGDGEA